MTDFTQAIPILPEPDWHAVAGIPIVDAGTPLEALGLSREFSVWPAYHKLGIPHAIPECHARGEVFERLPAGRRRPPRQRAPGGAGRLARRSPCSSILYDSLSSALAALPRAGEAERNGSPASSSRRRAAAARRPAHISPAAVDVTLCDAQGRWLDMGSAFGSRAGLLHRLLRMPADDARQRRVRDHRRLLYHAMLDAGFSNLPSEWWHYDFGDHSGPGTPARRRRCSARCSCRRWTRSGASSCALRRTGGEGARQPSGGRAERGENCWRNDTAEPKPASPAIACTECSVVSSRRGPARRSACSHWLTVVPVSWRKCRVKVRRLISTRCARLSRLCAWSRFCAAHQHSPRRRPGHCPAAAAR